MKIISLDDSIYKLVSDYPEIKDILFELGFTDIIKPGMIQTVGKFMNLRKGAVAKKLDLAEVIRKLEEAGFLI